MDYAKAARRAAARRSRPDPDAPPRRARPLGWRTEWPEEFPVITTRKDSVDNDIRPIDYNGHSPADDGTCDMCPECCCTRCLEEDPVYLLGWERGFSTAMGRVLQVAHDRLSAALDRLDQPAA